MAGRGSIPTSRHCLVHKNANMVGSPSRFGGARKRALRKAEELLSRALPVPSTRRHVQLRLHQGTGPGPELPVKLLFGPRKCDRFVWVSWSLCQVPLAQVLGTALLSRLTRGGCL